MAASAHGLAANANVKAVPRHSLFDDLQGLATGTLFVALGLLVLREAGLFTGGTTGIALVLQRVLNWPFGALLFAVNLPFYWLAWRRMGPRFTVKTLAAVSLLSVLSEVLPRWIGLTGLNPVFAALAGGLLIGVGFVMVFRHQASLGGLNVLVLWLQGRRGWRAGHLQMGIDVLILLAALPWLDGPKLALSVVAAVAMNFALGVNHRPGRYQAI